LRIAAVLTLSLAAANCTPSSGPSGRLFTGGIPASTIAFESIDGPPQAVFRRLVATLGEEAEARKVAVVSREGAAAYRVRGYLSAQVERKATTIAWVFDVYDADKRRVLRISGSEPAGQRTETRRREAWREAQRNAWAAADDQVLRQVARNGMDRIVAFLNAPDAPPAAPASEPGGSAVAMIPNMIPNMATDDPAPALIRTAAAAEKR
jgi:hypothetical protein